MRLLGVTIPDEKKIIIAITYIYGIGSFSAGRILKAANIDENKKAKDIAPDEANRIKELITKNYKVEGELRQNTKQNIARLKEINSYRGDRHSRHLPVRGQRTKTNSRTAHGNTRKIAGSGRRKIGLK